MATPECGTEDYRRHAALFNDVTYAPTGRRVLFSDRKAIADYLWEQGWRRDVRSEDVNTTGVEAMLADGRRESVEDARQCPSGEHSMLTWHGFPSGPSRLCWDCDYEEQLP